MANRLESGFVKADSQNLPRIDMFMVCEYITNNDRFNAAEMRNAKAAMSSRENYGDQAIGYVCLQRKQQTQGYSVTLIVNEEEEKILDVECHSCAAASGGCKHAIAFLMWTYRRSEHPAVTEVECYWRRSTLASVGTAKKFIECSEMVQSSFVPTPMPDNAAFFQALVKTAEEKQLDSQLTRHNYKLKSCEAVSLSIHQLLIKFIENDGKLVDDFMAFATTEMSDDLCQNAEKLTRAQSEAVFWHELRYGRITASRIYEAAHCRTEDGSLIQQIIGAAEAFETHQMKRGRLLESSVLEEVSKKTGLYFRKCGLHLMPSFPMLGASPDGICNDFIAEVKCPSTSKAFDKFLPEGKMNSKCKAQMQLQLLATGKRKGIFCVADPDFENTKNTTVLWESFEEEYVNGIIEKASRFWKEYIFSKMMNNLCN